MSEQWWESVLSMPRVPDLEQVLGLLSQIAAGNDCERRTSDSQYDITVAQAQCIRRFLEEAAPPAERVQVAERFVACLSSPFCQSRHHGTALTAELLNSWSSLLGPEVTLNVCLGLADRCSRVVSKSALLLKNSSLPASHAGHWAYSAMATAKEIAGGYGQGRGLRQENIPGLRVLRRRMPQIATELELRHSLPCQHR